jgi:hypothetical protein
VSFKVPAVQRQEYTIYLQSLEGATWAHCDVRKWTPEVRKKFTADANALYALHGGPMYAMNEPAGCEKHRKFLRLMGFELFREVPTPNGTQYVFKR